MPSVYRAGQSLEDYCRACKTDRLHTVIVVDEAGQPLRVACGFCGSDHNYRGGPRVGVSSPAPVRHAPGIIRADRPDAGPLPLVTDRERRTAPMAPPGRDDDLELLIRRVIREEAGLSPVVPAEKWRGGQLVLRPGREGVQEKSWPVETFFHKIVMIRNRLRTLEQQINAADLPDDTKIRLQAYITGCYGSLTSLNVLFADEADKFTGTSQD